VAPVGPVREDLQQLVVPLLPLSVGAVPAPTVQGCPEGDEEKEGSNSNPGGELRRVEADKAEPVRVLGYGLVVTLAVLI
jgi:hypothetical protein